MGVELVALVLSASYAITWVEITRSQASNAYDAVRLLRPYMLRVRETVTIQGNDAREPLVYVDDQRLGGISELQKIPVTDIFEIRYHTAAQAQLEWESGHAQRGIQVVTVRRIRQAKRR